MKAIVVDKLKFAVRPHFWSSKRQLLRSVSFSVEEGGIFGFLGPNGAGKTTTIKALLGLLRPDGGTIELLGRDPSDAAARRDVGFLPERSYFSAHLKARELLTQHGVLAGISFGESRRRAAENLERVGLADAADQLLGSFSKGMLQRAGLGQALMGDPKLLVLDEPMSGLDPLGRRDVRQLMLELRAAGKTIFFSTHILPDVESICDQVAIMARGRVHRVGPLNELLQETARAVEITASCSDALANELQPHTSDTTKRGGIWVFEIPDQGQANALLDRLRGGGAQIRSVQSHRASLEDLFVHLVEDEQKEVA